MTCCHACAAALVKGRPRLGGGQAALARTGRPSCSCRRATQCEAFARAHCPRSGACLQGRKAKFVPGWDCHGLPIELKVLQVGQGATAPAVGAQPSRGARAR